MALTASRPVVTPRHHDARSSLPDLHGQLKAATNDVHQRLHRHPGFAAVQDETIDRARYIALLRRLLGFHRPFEIAAGFDPVRSGRLVSDLGFLGSDDVPAMCREIPQLRGAEGILGALYVVEGSALGGRGLARHLDVLLGAGAIAGRRFFAGNGADTGAEWRAYLARLAGVSPDPTAQRRVIGAAIATFVVFEAWLRDWDKGL